MVLIIQFIDDSWNICLRIVCLKMLSSSLRRGGGGGGGEGGREGTEC